MRIDESRRAGPRTEGKPARVSASEAWSKADIHIHSNHSDGLPRFPRSWSTFRHQTDLNVIAITDHNTIEGALFAQSLAELYDFEVIVGEEVSSREGHILGLFLTKTFRAGMSPADTVRAIEAQGGIAIIAHPFSAQGVFGPTGRNLFRRGRQRLGVPRFRDLQLAAVPRVGEQHGRRRCSPAATAWPRPAAATRTCSQAVGKGYTLFRGTTAEELKQSILNLETRAESTRQGLSFAWRYARQLPAHPPHAVVELGALQGEVARYAHGRAERPARSPTSAVSSSTTSEDRLPRREHGDRRPRRPRAPDRTDELQVEHGSTMVSSGKYAQAPR